MIMSYLKITISVALENKDMLIANMSAVGYDSFIETETGIEAYIGESNFNITVLQTILGNYDLAQNPLIEEIEDRNWNEEWEKHFEPVFIEDSIAIRASFHKIGRTFTHEILIDPEMTFGTGHHQTTQLMMLAQLRTSHQDKRVLDIGTGTGILSILAYGLGAFSIDATDTDEGSIENSRKNFILNNVKNYQIHKGAIEKLTFEYTFDIILANINKNVLMAEIGYYKKLMSTGGVLLLSGFYEKNVPELIQEAIIYGLKKLNSTTLDKWACLAFERTDK